MCGINLELHRGHEMGFATCGRCGGRGRMGFTPWSKKCDACDGSGRMSDEIRNHPERAPVPPNFPPPPPTSNFTMPSGKRAWEVAEQYRAENAQERTNAIAPIKTALDAVFPGWMKCVAPQATDVDSIVAAILWMDRESGMSRWRELGQIQRYRITRPNGEEFGTLMCDWTGLVNIPAMHSAGVKFQLIPRMKGSRSYGEVDSFVIKDDTFDEMTKGDWCLASKMDHSLPNPAKEDPQPTEDQLVTAVFGDGANPYDEDGGQDGWSSTNMAPGVRNGNSVR